MFLLNVPVAIERTEGIHVFIASQVLYYWINVFVTKKTIDCYEGYFITSSQKFSLWPPNEDRNKHFKVNLTGGRNLTGQRQTS